MSTRVKLGSSVNTDMLLHAQEYSDWSMPTCSQTLTHDSKSVKSVQEHIVKLLHYVVSRNF